MNINPLKLIVFSFLVLYLFSCIDPISLPFRDESDKLVVDGMITNLPPPYTITLSTSITYESPTFVGTLPNYLSGAQVSIIDDRGNVEKLREVEKGRYKSAVNGMQGEVGRSYRIEIIMLDGRKFTSAPERLNPTPNIDSLSSEYDSELKGHYFFVNTTDPAGEKNYYRWTAYGIGSIQVRPATPAINACQPYCWQYFESRTLNILSDDFIDGNLIRGQRVFFAPMQSDSDYSLEVTQFSLTKDAFRFQQLLEDQRNRTGSIFDPPPATIVGNIYNANNPRELALGYFGASAVVRSRITIRRDKLLVAFPQAPLAREGRCCEAIGGTSPIRPDWRN
jgi:hypothetical protein